MKSQPHSQTSIAAAEAIEPTAGTLRGQVLSFLRSNGGCTDEQMQAGLEMNPSTQRPRRVELCEAGLVVDSGKVRRTAAGRSAVVWIAVGREQQEELAI